MCVGKKIKSYLESNGITQTFVANRTGIPVQKLNLSLNGNRRLDFDEYELICGALSVGTDKFLEPKLPEQEMKNMKRHPIMEYVIPAIVASVATVLIRLVLGW